MDARRADVIERDGTVLVRKSNGNWYFLRKSASNPNAFVLEGEYGDKYLLQLDSRVRDVLLPVNCEHGDISDLAECYVSTIHGQGKDRAEPLVAFVMQVNVLNMDTLRKFFSRHERWEPKLIPYRT